MDNFFYTNEEMESLFRSRSLQYPSEYSLDDLIIKMKELNKFTTQMEPNKSIAVVGNSGKLLDQDYSELIDSHDLVFRCNLALTEGFEHKVGSKTDLRFIAGKSFWRDLTGQFSGYEDNFLTNLENQSFIIKAEPPYAAIQGIIKNYNTKSNILFLRQEKINNFEKNANLHDITLGLTAICTALEWSDNVSVFGFSFFQEGWDKQHYFESITPYHRGHDPISEKDFVELLEKNGRLKTY